jgi:ubiquinone/menaquinone biosynthesis C-methylase UbiE
MDIEKQYNDFAQNFSEKHFYANRISRDVFYKQINFSIDGKKLLDLGCGDGDDLCYYKKLGAKVFGIDASAELIKIAKNKLPKDYFEIGTFSSINFKNNYFDIVFSKYAIQTAKKINPIFKEVNRVLKSRGIFQILVVHPIRQFIEKKHKNKNYFKQEIVNSILFDGTITVQEPTHTMDEYLNSLIGNGFQLIGYGERYDTAAEKIDGDIYPGFMIIKMRKI